MKECERICQALKEGVRCVLLRGAAGTGKTTLVRDLLTHIQMMGCHPILLAPTGRAAKVLELRTGRKARTVHAAIYDVPSEPTWDAEQESWRWHFGIQKTIPAGAVIIVDEASLVGRTHQADENLVFGTGSLLDDLIRWSGVGLPECTNRIVFVGDAYQLPPVGDPLGTPPALDPDVVSDLVGQRPLVQERHAEEFSSLDAEARRLRLRELLRQSVLLHAPIVTYGYALTVHKAQGGDWDEVWVDCRYAGRPNSEEYFRWMYTATTRAKRKLVVVEAPRIDDLVEALSNGIERMEGEGVAEDNAPEHPVRNLGDVLGTGGYLLRRCVERDWVHRYFVGHAGSDLECGWIDVGYNGKKTVTHLSIHIDDLAESVRKDLLALKGLPMNRVMGSERRPEKPEKGLPEICVVPQHELVANRLCVAAHGRLTILSVTSKGPFLLRMTLRTERGVAFVDCYFDGKGVVTKMGNATLPLEDLRALRDGLTAKKKERNVQDDA